MGSSGDSRIQTSGWVEVHYAKYLSVFNFGRFSTASPAAAPFGRAGGGVPRGRSARVQRTFDIARDYVLELGVYLVHS